ncbi:unnamed protein product [Dovyalis caffra]|uniref:Uncharacterized protein n=1 Tax=Dovyalis caffra TaxID=77055 RepID=A0AAV1RCI6_9ROSI|nr:unnamed protein product [Dovyalis caffra]
MPILLQFLLILFSQTTQGHISHGYPLCPHPIIDLNDPDRFQLVQQVSRACKEYGFFQITNHGVQQELCERMMGAITEFFELPPEEKAQFFTTELTKQVKLLNYYLKIDGQDEKVTMRSESFSHPWHPLDDIIHLLPQNPPQEVVAECGEEVRALINRLLSLISQGLGLEKGVLKKRLAVHTGLSTLAVLRQSEGVGGLQVIKDGKWVAVDPVPNAFVINIGDQIQVI